MKKENISIYIVAANKLVIACIAVMLLTVCTSYGQRPANSQPSNNAPMQLTQALFNNQAVTTSDTAKKRSDVATHLQALVQKGALSQTDTDYIITSEHISSLSGVHHIYYRQAINGIEVIGTEASLHIDNNGEVFKSNERDLIKNINAQMKSAAGGLTAQQAIQTLANSKNYGNVTLTNSNREASGYHIFTHSNASGSEVLAKQAYYTIPNDGIRMVWEVIFSEQNSSSAWNARIDAATGQIIDQFDMTISCNIAGEHYHNDEALAEATVAEEDCDDSAYTQMLAEVNTNTATAAAADGASYMVYALPLESPFFGDRTLEVDPADPVASPFGWHDTNGAAGAEFTITRGNNTHTYDDINNNNIPDGFDEPDGGTSLVFNFPFDAVDTQGDPTFSNANRSLDAASVNTFYWTNVCHDLAYLYGFDEASANFQENNYGNGGSGGDGVSAEVQDGSGTCNANFAPFPEGTNPRMQMFTCVSRDGDYDNLVIVHEYAHGISTRLTGGGANSGSLNNQEQMGEGWSDYYGYMWTMDATNFDQDRVVGTFLFADDPFGNGADVDGIRSFPYSDNTVVNPQTYQTLINLGNANVAPHLVGEIWGVMLFDLTQALINQHGFDADLYNGTGGNNISLALVTEALKLQPSSPGFVDGRDAILAADQALFGGANECIIWESFAARGLGFSADQGSSNSRADGTAAFDVPPITLELTQPEICLANGAVSLSGGITSGGTYSGPGVTDNGDGTTFTFDPVAAGEGDHTITYQATNCSGVLETDTDTVTVTNVEPELSACQDVTIALGADGTAVFDPFASTSLTIIGGDNQTNDQGFSIAALLVPEDITVSFDWSYTTTDGAGFDNAGYVVDNTYIQLTNNSITNQSGTETVSLVAGQVFGFAVGTVDNRFEAATAVFTNFSPGFSGDFASFNWEEFLQNSDGSTNFEGESASLLDSCGSLNVALSQEVFTCLDIGTTTPITITVTDSLGNEDTCVANVSVTGGAINTTTFSGGSWDNDEPTGNSMAVINDNYDSATMGDINACSCEINGNQIVTIRDGDFMNVAGNIVVDGTLIVENAGSVVQIDESAITTNNGTIQVQKTTPALGGRDFTLLSSPVTAETRNGVYQNAHRAFEIITNMFTPHPDVTTALNFIDVDFDYFAQASTLSPGQGFLVFPQAPNAAGSITLDHTYTSGTLNSGPINYPLVYNGPVTGNNFNLVGNPYASAIDTDMLITANDAINEVYYWEHLTPPTADNPGDNTTNHSMDDISIYNLTGGIAAVNGGTAPGRYMASGQGFGILADQDAVGATLDFTNAMRVTGNNGTVRTSDFPINKIWLQVSNQEATQINSTLIGFLNEATAQFDKGYDSQRLDTQLSLYSTLSDGRELSIQGREQFDAATQVQLGFSTKNETAQDYTISINQIEGIVLTETPVYLKDNLTGTLTNLKEEDYKFTETSSNQATRFTLFFTPEDVLSTNATSVLSNALTLYPNPSQGLLTLSYVGNETLDKAVITDINGKRVKEINLTDFNQSKEIDLSSFATGMYFIQIHTTSTIVTKKILRK